MEKHIKIFASAIMASLLAISCGSSISESAGSVNADAGLAGQSAVTDDVSQKNILQVAVGSPDHTTLVAAVKAADLVDALANAGPFTVFAPSDAAFKKLPAGTVEDLVKPENKEKLTNILEYHVSIGVFNEDMLQDGQSIGQANSQNIKITKKDGKIIINDKATVVGSVPASNGLIYVIDEVLLPPTN